MMTRASSNTGTPQSANSAAASTTAQPVVTIVTTIPSASEDEARKRRKAIKNAVYAHVRAMRALGHKTVNTTAIARSLLLNEREVRDALESLESKGVKTPE